MKGVTGQGCEAPEGLDLDRARSSCYTVYKLVIGAKLDQADTIMLQRHQQPLVEFPMRFNLTGLPSGSPVPDLGRVDLLLTFLLRQ